MSFEQRKSVNELPQDIRLKALSMKSSLGSFEAVKFLAMEHHVGLMEAKIFIDSHDEFGRFIPNYRRTSPKSVVEKVFMGVGVLLIAVAVVIYYNQLKFISNSLSVIADVTQLVLNDGGYTPVIQFELNNQPYEIIPNFSSNPPSYQVGEKVNVFVNPDNPYDIIVDSFPGRYMAITILGGMGAFFFLLGLALMMFLKDPVMM